MTATRHPQPEPGHQPPRAAEPPPARGDLADASAAITATDNRKPARATRAATKARRDVSRPATVAGTLRRALGRPAPAPAASSAPAAEPPAPKASPAAEPPATDTGPAAPPLAPGVAAEHLRARGLTASPAQRRRQRRRRLTWAAGILAVIAVSWLAIDRSSQPPSPEQVAERIHEAVQRDAAAQSGDPTIKVGKLDCVELEPGRGNCLADATSSWRPMEGMMLAVSYEPDPRNGDLSWSLRLP